MRAAIAASLALVAGAAYAQDDPYAWTAPGPRTQLYDDATRVPEGQGAVFVPALTSADAEPRILVVAGDDVLEGRIGEKLPLPPGRYVVLVGSGGPDHAVGIPVDVVAGQVTLVPVRWGGLRIETVDGRLREIGGELELVRLDTGERITPLPELWPGEEPPTTWLLQPGLYRVQTPGSDGPLRPDFTTVHVPEGGLVNLRVFMDRAGRIRGAGVIAPEDAAVEEKEEGPWAGSLVLGVSGSLAQSRNVVGVQDFALAEGGVYLDGKVSYTTERHQLGFDLAADESALFLQPATGKALPWIKSRDLLSAGLSYTFLLNDGAGIYARGGASLQALPTNAIAAEPLTVEYRELDGSVRSVDVAAAETYSLNDRFGSPLLIRAGTGLRTRLSTHRDVDLSLYAGVGGRRYRFDGAYLPDDNPGTDALEFSAVAPFTLIGPEVGASAGVRLTGFATYTGSVDLLAPLGDLDRYLIESGHDVTIRMTRALSVSYSLDFARIPQITDRTTIRQGLTVRLGWNIL